MSHSKGGGINTLVSAGKQQCLHLFTFQNNEVYVVCAVQLVEFCIVWGISWLAAEPVSFSRRTLCHGVSIYPWCTLTHAPFIDTCGSVTTVASLSVLYLVLFSVIIFVFFYCFLLLHFLLVVLCNLYCCNSPLWVLCSIVILSHNFYFVSVVKLVVCKLCLDWTCVCTKC